MTTSGGCGGGQLRARLVADRYRVADRHRAVAIDVRGQVESVIADTVEILKQRVDQVGSDPPRRRG